MMVVQEVEADWLGAVTAVVDGTLRGSLFDDVCLPVLQQSQDCSRLERLRHIIQRRPPIQQVQLRR